MNWKFWKKPVSAPPIRDERNWNEDWQIGDIAECVVDFEGWDDDVKPWHRPKKGQRFQVKGFVEGPARGNECYIAYFLHLQQWPVTLETIAFRKVRPLKKQRKRISAPRF